MKRGAMMLVAMLGGVAPLVSMIGPKPVPSFIWNVSESVPPGLYHLRAVDTLFVTELVAVLPPEPLSAFLADGGYLPRGVPMLKRVAALPGQTVCRNGATTTVDTIEMGDARERDGRGRLLPTWQGCHIVAQDEIFLMNWQSAESLDGRYFGPIEASAVIGRALPIWTNEED